MFWHWHQTHVWCPLLFRSCGATATRRSHHTAADCIKGTCHVTGRVPFSVLFSSGFALVLLGARTNTSIDVHVSLFSPVLVSSRAFASVLPPFEPLDSTRLAAQYICPTPPTRLAPRASVRSLPRALSGHFNRNSSMLYSNAVLHRYIALQIECSVKQPESSS